MSAASRLALVVARRRPARAPPSAREGHEPSRLEPRCRKRDVAVADEDLGMRAQQRRGRGAAGAARAGAAARADDARDRVVREQRVQVASRVVDGARGEARAGRGTASPHAHRRSRAARSVGHAARAGRSGSTGAGGRADADQVAGPQARGRVQVGARHVRRGHPPPRSAISSRQRRALRRPRGLARAAFGIGVAVAAGGSAPSAADARARRRPSASAGDLLRLERAHQRPRSPPPARRGSRRRAAGRSPPAPRSTADLPRRPARGHRLHLEVVGDDDAVVASARSRSRPSTIARRERRRAASRRARGTRTWAVMIVATPASIAVRNGRQLDLVEARRASGRPTGRSRCESTSVSPWPGKVLGAGRDPALLQARGSCAAPSRPTRSGSAPNERSPMTGFFGFVSTSTTGAKSQRMPQAVSSRGEGLPPSCARSRPRSPMRPSARSGGQTVQGSRSRATRPPSWSTATSSGRSWPASRAQRLQLAHELGHLLGRVDVAGEEDDVADAESRMSALARRARPRGPSKPTMKRWPTWRTALAHAQAAQPLARRPR